MNPELRLRLLKVFANVPLRLADRLLPEMPSTHFPQTKMLLRVYSRLLKAYRLDCLQGTFGVEPDSNFERLLRVSLKVLARISEDDRYYRAWLGLAFLLAHDDIERLSLSPADVKRLCKQQWLCDIDFLPDEAVEANKSEFIEIALCDYLGNLARMER